MASRSAYIRVRRTAAVAVGVLVVGLSATAGCTIAFAGPLSVYDELVLASLVKEKCHVKIDGENKIDRKIANAKLKSIGKAAFDQLWKNLDKQNRKQHAENGARADFMLKKRTENLIVSTYPKLIKKIGCAAAEQRAQKAFALIQ